MIYLQSAEGREQNWNVDPDALCGVAEMAILAKSLHLKCWLWRSRGSFKAVHSYIIDDTNGAETHQCSEGGLHGAEVAHFKCTIPRYTATSPFTNGRFLLPKMKTLTEMHRSSLSWGQLEKG